MPKASQRRRILFIGHDATRTGAPTALLHLLRWLKRNGDPPLSILLGGGGELLPEYEKIADTWVANYSKWCPGGIRSQILATAGLGSWANRAERSDIRKFAFRHTPALIYVNSVASARIVTVLAPTIPVLTHVHELGSVLGAPNVPDLLRRSRSFIACSHAVADHLIRHHRIPPERIDTVHESVPVDQIRPNRTRQEILDELHIPQDARTVMGCGTLSWRKGPDLFVQLARQAIRQDPSTHFFWVGGGSPNEISQFEHDTRAMNLGEQVHLTGSVTNSADYFAAADVFTLTSREDPYPLVCLEAAALGKPIVCFADAGGMPEFVEDDCGFAVPYLDVQGMADRIIRLLDCPACRQKMGEAARRKVTERHDVNVAASRILEIIERTIQNADR